MDNLYEQANRLLADTQHLLQQVLTTTDNVQETRIQENLEQLQQDMYRLQMMARKQVPSRRQEALMRVEQLNSDLQSVQRAYRNYQRRISDAEQEAKQREELLLRRYTPNSQGVDTSIPMDHGLQHQQSLAHANANLDSVLTHGSGIMTSLTGQKFTLKNAHRKLLDLTSTLGLSNTVMRYIEQRTAQDKYIFWGGLIFTSVVILLLIYYFVL